jgi:hypothetical protein
VVFTNPGHDMISMTGHRGDVRTGTLQSMARAAGWEWPVKK